MLVALPEIDGATNPTVFAGRHGPAGCAGCRHACKAQGTVKAMAPCFERIDALVEKSARLATLRRKSNATRRVAVTLFGFPPNAGAIGTAAYLSVFESLHNTLHRLAREGYDVTPPETVDELRATVLKGNAAQQGTEANVAAVVTADQIVARTPWLDEIEAVWGPAPGRILANGREVMIMGAHFGNVFVGVQPTFGYEGDPMRLLFERGFAPTHAFNAYYQYLRMDFRADVVLHFGMHGALEFMPGKQAGMGPGCWPDRLMGNMPNVYLYAANNPSEATLAKRRANAVTITHLTPPLQNAGLYRGLADLKDSLTRWREAPDDRTDLEALIAEQAAAVDLAGAPDTLWLKLLETEDALIPEGLHIVGRVPDAATVENTLNQMTFADTAARETARARPHRRPRADGAHARPLGPLHRPRPRRRRDPRAGNPADGPQHPRLRPVPHAHRLRHERRRETGAGAPEHARRPAAFGGTRPLGLRQHQVQRRPHRSGAGPHGLHPALRRARPALRRGPRAAGDAGPRPRRRGDDALGHLPRPAPARRPSCWPTPRSNARWPRSPPP